MRFGRFFRDVNLLRANNRLIGLECVDACDRFKLLNAGDKLALRVFSISCSRACLSSLTFFMNQKIVS